MTLHHRTILVLHVHIGAILELQREMEPLVSLRTANKQTAVGGTYHTRDGDVVDDFRPRTHTVLVQPTNQRLFLLGGPRQTIAGAHLGVAIEGMTVFHLAGFGLRCIFGMETRHFVLQTWLGQANAFRSIVDLQ